MMDGKKDTESGEEAGSNVAANVKASIRSDAPSEEQPEDRRDDISGSEPAAKVQKVEKVRAPSKGTYPKPKNFAERMMNVLENNVIPDVISWHGEDDLVAINIKGVKQSDILDDRFQGIKYAAFVRNLSRWGFRKIPKMDVSDGMVIYRNSLFQRENPHLVRHMKIDSDVQDIFGQHQRTAAQQEGPVAGPLHQQAPAPALPLRESSINLLSQLIAQQRQQQQTQLSPPPNVTSLSAQVSNILAQAQAQQQSGIVGRTPDQILEELVGLSREYLEIAPETDNASLESIKSLLRLVVGLGSEQLRAREPDGATPERPPAPQQQQPPAATPLLQELLMQMGQTQGQTGAPQQPPPPPQQQQQEQSSLIQSIQRQVAQQQQQQQQGPGSHSIDLQSLLSQATGISSLGGAPLNAQLLLQLQQQQQQQQQQQSNSNNNTGPNPNQPSPPGNNCRQS